MKTITNDYKTNIKEFGRELDTIITYTINNETIQLGKEDLNSVSLHYEGNLLKSVMKQLDIDSNIDIPIGTILTCQFGVLVEEEYEYINYGSFVVKSSEKKEDLNSYIITCYDKLLYSMKEYEGDFAYVLTEDAEFDDSKTYYEYINSEYVEYTGSKYFLTEDEEFIENKKYYALEDSDYVEYVGDRIGNPNTLGLYEIGDPSSLSLYEYSYISLSFPMTIKDYIETICTRIGLTFANSNDTFPNYDKIIPNELYLDVDGNSLNYTYRDILDELSQVTASNICINNDDELELRYINNTNINIDAEYIKDVNVNFGEYYGPINTVTLKRSADSDVISLSNPIDLDDNLKKEIVISDNQILNDNNRADYMGDILTELYGLQYYVNDFSSTGITFLELADKYNVVIPILDEEGEITGTTTYPCIMFNDEINITQGLEENIHAEIPNEAKTDYSTTTRDDRTKLRTELIVNKQEGKITGLVSEQVELDNRLDQAELTITSQGAKLDVATTNIDENGNILELKRTGYELGQNGLIIDDEQGYKSISDTTGLYYYDNDVITGKYTKDGGVYKDLALLGRYYYGIDEDTIIDRNPFNKDNAMFVSQTFIDENGDKCTGHFYNGGNV